MSIRTDLAIENIENDLKKEKIGDVDSYFLEENKKKYYTLDFERIDKIVNFGDLEKALFSSLDNLLPKEREKILVVGLGNTEITSDSVGPRVCERMLATRHITGEIAKATGLDRLRPVAVLATGVTGQTGIETGEYLLSIVKKIKPTAIIAIDALASRRLERLGCTLQISDTGIAPGAGVGNHRTKINSDTMGIPVIAIGVPTVVDAATMASDLLNIKNENDSNKLKEQLTPNGRKMVVTPKEIDLLIDRASKLISMSVNYSLHKGLELEDLAMLM